MKNNNNKGFTITKLIIALIVVCGIGLIVYFLLFNKSPGISQNDWNKFVQEAQENEKDNPKIKDKIEIDVSAPSGYNYVTVTVHQSAFSDTPGYFTVVLPDNWTLNENSTLMDSLASISSKVGASLEKPSIWLTLLINMLPILLIVIFGFWFYRSMMKKGGGGMELPFLKSKTRIVKTTTRFKDIAGYLEEKNEFYEIIQFLKDRKAFEAMGARVPRGVLLIGEAGTGKTMLAKAAAGEANVPFYGTNGSEFVEMFVGLGASRIRDLFAKAKKTAPCIIFIDEIDAVGRQRGTGLGGGNDEREQTLNQLLTEMDGLESRRDIIILAATNRADVLDPALLRPGRFDRHIQFHLPDVRERAAILRIHSRNKNIATDVDFEELAYRIPGFSGAQIENLLNEAAILSVRENDKVIRDHHIEEGIDRVIGGVAKTTRKYIEKEKSVIAHHEAGHAIIGLVLEQANKVQKVTIIPRGMAGGYTLMTPREEKFLATKSELIERIIGYLGGRASEEIFFDKSVVTSGAQNDIEEATKIATTMITKLGMGKMGPILLTHETTNPFVGKEIGSQNIVSQKTIEKIDAEVEELIQSCLKKAKDIIYKNKKIVALIAKALLIREVITAIQIEYIYKNKKLPKEIIAREKELKEKKQERVKKDDIQEKKPKTIISPK